MTHISLYTCLVWLGFCSPLTKYSETFTKQPLNNSYLPPIDHKTFIQRRLNVDATLYERHVPAGLSLHFFSSLKCCIIEIYHLNNNHLPKTASIST